MILTESDLHAYNRGELPPEAARRLEEDPLAVQDAARLRAIGEALRDEAPIPVTGRAETLDRLRVRSGSRMGVPGWIWAVGAACVFGLIMVSVPEDPKPMVQFRQVLSTTSSTFGDESMPPPEMRELQEKEMKGSLQTSTASDAPAIVLSAPASPAIVRAPAQERRRPEFRPQGEAVGDATATRASSPAKAETQSQRSERTRLVGGIDVARSSSLELRVEDAERAKAEAEVITKRLGGFVADASLARPNERPSATMTLRVPSPRFDQLVSEVKALGGLASEATAAEDVTAERVDSEARLTTMTAEERQLRELLGRTRNVNEVLKVRERLAEVRSEIEALTASLKLLKSRVEMATLQVTLTQRPKPGAPALDEGWPRDSVGGAVNALRGIGRRAGTAAIYVGVFSPIWLPLLALAYFRARRR